MSALEAERPDLAVSEMAALAKAERTGGGGDASGDPCPTGRSSGSGSGSNSTKKRPRLWEKLKKSGGEGGSTMEKTGGSSG